MTDAPRPRFHWRRFDELSPRELHDALRLRSRVFVVEQNCVYLDVDGRDPEALHLYAWLDAMPELAGYLRCFTPPGHAARIGRVITAPEVRGTGLGRRLMAEALRGLAERCGPIAVELSAQAHLERFYGSFGFARCSENYLEDGIPHCEMRLERLAVAAAPPR